MLQQAFPDGALTIISQDDYYLPIEQQTKDVNGKVNFDTPDSIDHQQLAADLDSLKEGTGVRLRQYTFNNIEAESKAIELVPAPILIIEGLFILHHEQIDRRIDRRVFIKAEEHQRLERRIRRDAEERGYPEAEVRYQWEHHVEPAYKAYLEPHLSRCTTILDNSEDMSPQVEELITQLKKYI
jgi:uridine kinase